MLEKTEVHQQHMDALIIGCISYEEKQIDVRQNMFFILEDYPACNATIQSDLRITIVHSNHYAPKYTSTKCI